MWQSLTFQPLLALPFPFHFSFACGESLGTRLLLNIISDSESSCTSQFLHLDFNSQFTAFSIPNVNFLIFLHFAFSWIPIVNFLTILHFALWIPIVNFLSLCVLHFGSNCQFSLPFCVFAFWTPIYHHSNFTLEWWQTTMNIQCWQYHAHHHPPITPTYITLLAQPCPL